MGGRTGAISSKDFEYDRCDHSKREREGEQINMEAAIKASDLCETQMVSHGSSQRSPTRNARPVFVPKQPPRPRQRGALPREPDEPAHFPQHAGASLAQHFSTSRFNAPFTQETPSSSSQQAASLNAFIPPMEEQTLRGQPTDFPTPFIQLPPQLGSLNKRKKRKNTAPLQTGDLPIAGKFSRSWHRVSPQEPSHQRGVLPPAQEKNYRPRQRGAIRPPFQEQAFQAPFAHTSSSPGPPSAPLLVSMEPRVFPQMKSPFLEMWLQLEGAIESRERMLMGMKAEMEKSLSQMKIYKDDALKEREEVEARKAGVTENMEIVSNQTGKIKSVREGLEQISTDLSVQVAELNRLLQQVQEQQRVLKVLESLKDHHDASNDENSFMSKNLQDCEVKLATMERELAGSKQTSELLEKAALKRIGDLEEIEAGCGLTIYFATNASSNPPVVSSTPQRSQGTTEIFSKMRMDARASGLNGEREIGHAAALKQPKLEVVS